MNGKIKVGLLLDSFNQPMWAYRMLEEIKKQDFVEICLVVKNKSGGDNKSRLQKLKEQYKNVFYQLYRTIEDKISRPSPNAFQLKDISSLIDLNNINRVDVTPVKKIHSDYFTDADVEKIKKQEIDVFVRLGFRILRGKVLRSAKLGIWSYHHGDSKVNKGGPPGVWESIQRWKETGSVLQILSEELDGGTILYRSWAATDRDFINRNINKFYWKTASFLPRTLKKLHELGPDDFFAEIALKNQDPVFYSNRLFKKPQNTEFLRLIFAKSFSLAKYALWRAFNFEQWMLLYAFKKEDEISTTMFRYKKMIPGKKVFWADPCVVQKDNKHYIFLEEFVYKKNKAHISVIEIDQNGNYKQPKIVLETTYHLSYPFVFESNGIWYMIPESLEKKTIELYKAVQFPDKWEFVMNLMADVYACDTTIHFKDGKCWLFACMKQYQGDSCHDELFLFYSDSLLTKNWVSHKNNPVISDVKVARPAGGLFMHNNNLYRPSQDCSQKYGRAININLIVIMDEEKYEEVPVTRIEPNWDTKITRTHTISSAGGLSVIDGFMDRSKLF